MEITRNQMRSVFWLIYICLPLFTGFLSYNWLSQEYDERNHILLSSHSVECGPNGLNSCDSPDSWKDRNTGKIYHSSEFKAHRRSESIRIAILTFLYGLIGCAFYAWDEKKGSSRSFKELFKEALFVNSFLAIIIVIVL